MLVRTHHDLTYAGARVALDAALARAAEIGGAFNIAVSDSTGGLLAFARMDGAFAASGPIAGPRNGSSSVGNTKRKTQPRGGLGSTQMRPAWDSMIERQMFRPMPMPSGLVV